MAYPNRLGDLTHLFGRSKSELSLIFNEVIDHVYEGFGCLISSLDVRFLNHDHIQRYADTVHRQGVPLTRCWGFIDGTARPICRPGQHQRVVFSGHKRCHVLKFQSIVIPNGLIANLFGPIEGRRHDSGMLAESQLLEQLEARMTIAEEPYYLYGDPAYPVRPHLMAPFKGHLTDEEKLFNKSMSKVRECVEWGFGKIVQYWAFLDFKKNLKLALQPVGKYYLVGALLTNCHTCLYGSLTGSYFGMQPPTLHDYLHAHPLAGQNLTLVEHA